MMLNFVMAIFMETIVKIVSPEPLHMVSRIGMYSLNMNPATPDIADAIADTVLELGPIFPGPKGNEKTVFHYLAIAKHETNFDNAAIADEGKYGESVCFGAVLNGSRELTKDPWACARAMYPQLKWSVHSCPEHPFAGYARGPAGCHGERGQQLSLEMVRYIAIRYR